MVGYIIGCVYVLNILLFCLWSIMAKIEMKKDNISWSGGYDALGSCLLIWLIFIPPLGTIFLVGCIFMKIYK